jgi:hypothetical protein
MTLAEALAEAAAELPGVEAIGSGGTTEWTAGGRPFAAAAGANADFQLSPVVARAALGTPDTAPSPRGRDWVTFSPPELDRFALYRATAWFASAYRQAASARG